MKNVKELDGVLVTQSEQHPNFWTSNTGRVVGKHGRWLSLRKGGAGKHPCVHYTIVEDGVRKSVNVFVHQLVAEAYLDNHDNLPVIDHRNGNVEDNSMANLRYATRRQNSQNRKEKREGTASSKYVGVCWKKKNRNWNATITTGRKSTYLGAFSLEEDAAKAYDAALIARGLQPINFPA